MIGVYSRNKVSSSLNMRENKACLLMEMNACKEAYVIDIMILIAYGTFLLQKYYSSYII